MTDNSAWVCNITSVDYPASFYGRYFGSRNPIISCFAVNIIGQTKVEMYALSPICFELLRKYNIDTYNI